MNNLLIQKNYRGLININDITFNKMISSNLVKFSNLIYVIDINSRFIKDFYIHLELVLKIKENIDLNINLFTKKVKSHLNAVCINQLNRKIKNSIILFK